MKPKEKAAELILMYMAITVKLDLAKKCALATIDKQIELYNELNSLGVLQPNSVGIELFEIKQEIENL
jgi:hypothetical protein